MLAAIRRVPALGLASDLFTTSDGDIATLENAERRRQGYRGRGFDDPRIIGSAGSRRQFAGAADWLSLTAPGIPTQLLQPGAQTQINLGEGRLDIAVTVSDERVGARASVGKPLSVIRINPGLTNPASY